MVRNTRQNLEDEKKNGDSDFQWIGEGCKVKRMWQYRSCRVNGIVVTLNDNVLIKQGDDDDDEDKQPALGQLLELYESIGNDPNRAKVRWYFYHHEMPKSFRSLVEPEEQEVYTSLDDSHGGVEDIDAETIIGNCNVHKCFDKELPKCIGESDFFTRYCFGAGLGIKCFKEERTPKGPTKISKSSKSEPPKARRSLMPNRKPLEALENNPLNGSPKRKGSDSVYKECSAPPDKVKKRNKSSVSTPSSQAMHRRFSTQQAVNKLLDSDDEDLGSLSDSSKSSISTQSSVKSNASSRSNASSKSSKRSKKTQSVTTTKIKNKEENIRTENSTVATRRKSCMPAFEAKQPPAVARVTRSAIKLQPTPKSTSKQTKKHNKNLTSHEVMVKIEQMNLVDEKSRLDSDVFDFDNEEQEDKAPISYVTRSGRKAKTTNPNVSKRELSTRSHIKEDDDDFVNESESGESSGEEAEIESESDGDVSNSD
eukprot:TCONS_00058448-protein